MIYLTFSVDNLSSVLQAFDRIQIRRYLGEGTPITPITDLVALTEYTTVSGTDEISNRKGVSDVLLLNDYTQYYFTEDKGESDDWYISRYYHIGTGSTSGWSDPILGEAGDLFYSPDFPPEISYGSSDQMVIDRIRLYIGDPIRLRRDHGAEAASSIHSDGKVYELSEKGWPVFINMGGIQFTETTDVTVNGYRFLKFNTYIDETCVTCSGIINLCGEEITKEITNGVDIWYYTFRNSDRQIMEVYDNCPPPVGLTTTTANGEAYMLQTAVDLVSQELFEDGNEDGAVIRDEGSFYDPGLGQATRLELLKRLQKRLDALTRSLVLSGISGVLID